MCSCKDLSGSHIRFGVFFLPSSHGVSHWVAFGDRYFLVFVNYLSWFLISSSNLAPGAPTQTSTNRYEEVLPKHFPPFPSFLPLPPCFSSKSHLRAPCTQTWIRFVSRPSVLFPERSGEIFPRQTALLGSVAQGPPTSAKSLSPLIFSLFPSIWMRNRSQGSLPLRDRCIASVSLTASLEFFGKLLSVCKFFRVAKLRFFSALQPSPHCTTPRFDSMFGANPSYRFLYTPVGEPFFSLYQFYFFLLAIPSLPRGVSPSLSSPAPPPNDSRRRTRLDRPPGRLFWHPEGLAFPLRDLNRQNESDATFFPDVGALSFPGSSSPHS